jgi:hypothetical protein
VRGDYFVRLAVDIDRGDSVFLYDLCAGSLQTCRSPAHIKFEADLEHLADEFLPGVSPPAPPPKLNP